MNDDLKTSQAGLKMISGFEGCVLHVYNDGVGVATIGIGTTIYPDGTPVKFGDPDITKEQALEYLSYGIDKFEKCVKKNVEVELNQNQFDALVSFTYNVGCGGLQKSSLLRRINSSNFDVRGNFLLWNKAGGRILDGLTTRREAEWKVFNTPVTVENTGTTSDATQGTPDIGTQAQSESDENSDKTPDTTEGT